MHDSLIDSTARWIIRGKIEDHNQRIFDKRWEHLDWNDSVEVAEFISDRSVFQDSDREADDILYKMDVLDSEGQPGGFDTIVEKINAYMSEVWKSSPDLSPSAADCIAVGRIKQVTSDLLNHYYDFAWPEKDS